MQFKDRKHLSFAAFDEATDEFFSKIEAQKLDAARMQQVGVINYIYNNL